MLAAEVVEGALESRGAMNMLQQWESKSPIQLHPPRRDALCL